jgi:hypothetical protein
VADGQTQSALHSFLFCEQYKERVTVRVSIIIYVNNITFGSPLVSESFVIPLLSRNVKVKMYKTIILPVVLYGCETWSLALREEHRLRMFENRVLRRIFGPKRDEVTGEWRKLHNEELHILLMMFILTCISLMSK